MANQNVLPLKVTLAADSTIPAAVMLSAVSIDGKTAAATTLYTVPTGKTAIIQRVALLMTSASNVTGDATVSVGVAAAEYADIVAEVALTGFNVTGQVATLSPIALTAVSAAAAAVIKLDVDSAATTTGGDDTYTFTAQTFGYLI